MPYKPAQGGVNAINRHTGVSEFDDEGGRDGKRGGQIGEFQGAAR